MSFAIVLLFFSQGVIDLIARATTAPAFRPRSEPQHSGVFFREVISQAALEPRLSLAEVSSLTAGRSLEPADVKAGLGAIHLLASHEAASDCYTWIDLRCTFGFKEWCVLLEEQQSVRGGQGPLTGDRFQTRTTEGIIGRAASNHRC